MTETATPAPEDVPAEPKVALRPIRLSGETGEEAVRFRGPGTFLIERFRPPITSTSPAGRPDHFDPWAAWWAGVARACRRLLAPRRSNRRRPS